MWQDGEPTAVKAAGLREGVAGARIGAGLAVFTVTLFASALLLFSVQPMFAKMVLPRLGGTPAVWSIAMVFFQAVLLAGYAYAHLLVRHAGHWALLVHIAVMAVALAWLPLGIAAGYEVAPSGGFAGWLLALFASSVGVPFFAVAANAPLLQAWFSRTGHPHAGDPYFLYGASNLGSFVALLAYPTLCEPFLPLSGQARVWTAGYVILSGGVLACGLLARAGARTSAWPQAAAGAEPPALPVSGRQRLEWMWLACVPSALLVALTAHLSTDIAAAPFLWVMPLAAYLLTFVLAFGRQKLVPARWVQLLVPIVAIAALPASWRGLGVGAMAAIAINLFALFVIALAWHTELVTRRPAAARLTEFYLCMSAGGVLGAAFTSLLAPVLFSGITEFPLLLAVSLLAIPEMRRMVRRPLTGALAVVAVVALCLIPALRPDIEYRHRNFFGVIETLDYDDPGARVLLHGTTIHGGERIADMAPDRTRGTRPTPLTYYAPGGPMAQTLAIEHARKGPLSVGVVGLGAGSLACYSAPGDRWRYFEIDPAVIAIARNPRYFTFLADCQPDAAVVQGDARLSMAGELDGGFDLLVIDAFSSDAIPVHLITREALALYMRKLAPGGVLVLHISNIYLDLDSVVAATAAADGLAAVRLDHTRTKEEIAKLWMPSDVVALAADPAVLAPYREAGWKDLIPAADRPVAPWSDDYSDLVSAILRKQGFL